MTPVSNPEASPVAETGPVMLGCSAAPLCQACARAAMTLAAARRRSGLLAGGSARTSVSYASPTLDHQFTSRVMPLVGREVLS